MKDILDPLEKEILDHASENYDTARAHLPVPVIQAPAEIVAYSREQGTYLETFLAELEDFYSTLSPLIEVCV